LRVPSSATQLTRRDLSSQSSRRPTQSLHYRWCLELGLQACARAPDVNVL